MKIRVPLGLGLVLWLQHRQGSPHLALGVSERIPQVPRLIATPKTVKIVRRKKAELSFPFLLLPPLLSSHGRARGTGLGEGRTRAEEEAQELWKSSEM